MGKMVGLSAHMTGDCRAQQQPCMPATDMAVHGEGRVQVVVAALHWRKAVRKDAVQLRVAWWSMMHRVCFCVLCSSSVMQR